MLQLNDLWRINMVNCKICGANLKEGQKFCGVCGAKIEKHETSITQRTHVYNSEPTKKDNKNNKRLIIGIIAIIIIAIAILIVMVILIGKDSVVNSSLVGTWEARDGGYLYIFNADGTLSSGMAEIGTIKIGTWNTNGNELCIEFAIEDFEDYFPSEIQCMSYSISDDGNTMTWSYYGQQLIFTKK